MRLVKMLVSSQMVTTINGLKVCYSRHADDIRKILLLGLGFMVVVLLAQLFFADSRSFDNPKIFNAVLLWWAGMFWFAGLLYYLLLDGKTSDDTPNRIERWGNGLIRR
jgi:hypothetical protein